MYTPGCRGPEKKDLELAARCVTKARGSTEMTGHKAAQTEIRFTSVVGPSDSHQCSRPSETAVYQDYAAEATGDGKRWKPSV